MCSSDLDRERINDGMAAGGGSAPARALPDTGTSLRHKVVSASQIPQNAATFPTEPGKNRPPVVITYEYPLNERIRTLLRLEDLFERARNFLSRTDPYDHHVALITLFEILEVAGRADLKSDLLQELERQKQVLLTFRGNPDI